MLNISFVLENVQRTTKVRVGYDVLFAWGGWLQCAGIHIDGADEFTFDLCLNDGFSGLTKL